MTLFIVSVLHSLILITVTIGLFSCINHFMNISRRWNELLIILVKWRNRESIQVNSRNNYISNYTLTVKNYH